MGKLSTGQQRLWKVSTHVSMLYGIDQQVTESAQVFITVERASVLIVVCELIYSQVTVFLTLYFKLLGAFLIRTTDFDRLFPILSKNVPQCKEMIKMRIL